MNYFWTLTPKQFQKHIKVFNTKEKQRAEEIDIFNHILGQYISYAFNDPAKYPKKPFLMQKKTEKKVMTAEEMERQARINTIKMGGKINDS